MRVAQADAYFERCYAADRDPARTDDERRACWGAWHADYEVGQPPDRIDYVHERLVMLDPASRDAITLSTTDDTGEADPPSAPGPSAPSPVDASGASDAAPREPGTDPRGPAPRRRPLPPRTSTAACAAGCEPDFVTCARACRVGDRGCTDACRHTYRQCARGCY